MRHSCFFSCVLYMGLVKRRISSVWAGTVSYEHRLLVRPWHLAHAGLSFVPNGPASSSFLL
jgi:hypothetical protein